MNEPIIKVQNLTKRFNENRLFENISLDIFQKEIIGVLGLSGCGKSTFLNVLCGFSKPNSGEVYFKVDNYKKKYLPIYHSNKQIKSEIGFSAQNPSFYDELTVYENLRYFGILANVSKNKLDLRIDQLLKQFNLISAKDTNSKNLSQGMKKRLDFACAIIHEPKVLVLDEPTSNLDYKLREDIIEYIKKINQTGVCIIFVTHFISEMENICTKVLMLSNNKYHITKPNRLKQQFEEFLRGKQE